VKASLLAVIQQRPSRETVRRGQVDVANANDTHAE